MDYVWSIAALIGLYVILAASFDLIIGWGGLISIAHPIFFALGAYTSSLLAMLGGVPIPIAIVAGAAVALLASLTLSLPALRISGDYLLIASIGFQLGLLQVIKNLDFMGGPGGLSNIPALFAGRARTPAFALLTCAVAAGVVLLVRWIVTGDYGRAIRAMRDDEQAFTALGRNAMGIKIVLFAVGSGLAGLAGALYAHHYQYVSPEQFEILQSALILTMVVVGGMGTTWGPVVGALVLVALPQAITFLNLPVSVMAPLQGILYTLLVLAFLFLRPQGLVAGKSALDAPPQAS